ncbi:transcriptional corepressor LEUNIG_homolog-like protein isoform X1, partial [Tanacetum coccineum]
FIFQKERICDGENHKLFSCSFSSNGEFLAFAGMKGEVLLWDVGSRTPLPNLKLPNTILNVCFQPDTTFLAASCGYKIYYCDSTKVSEAPVVLIGHAKPTEQDEYFYTWPIIVTPRQGGNARRKQEWISSQHTSVDFCPTDRHLMCSCDSHGEVHIWNVESRLILCKFKEAAGASHVKFGSRNMLAIAAGRRIMLLSLIHTDSGEIKETSRFHLEVSSSSRGVFGK